MSHVTEKRSSSLWFPMVFAIVRNLSSIRPFLSHDCLLFLLLLECCMGSLCREGLTSLAFCSEITGFEMIPEMLVMNVLSCCFCHARSSDFQL